MSNATATIRRESGTVIRPNIQISDQMVLPGTLFIHFWIAQHGPRVRRDYVLVRIRKIEVAMCLVRTQISAFWACKTRRRSAFFARPTCIIYIPSADSHVTLPSGVPCRTPSS